MQNYPKVSIVTPSYNQGEFIENNILSVKNQNYPNIEHIIVDGGSTDNTLEILKKYEGTYNMRWISEPDNGMYEAINKGLDQSQGEIFAYLNTDDLYLPWTVRVVINFFNYHPEIELCYGDRINMDLETGRNRLCFCPEFDLYFLIRRGFLGQPTVFFRRSVVDKVGLFDDQLQLVGDCEYWMRAGKQCKVSKIEEFLAIERDHIATQRSKCLQQLLKELKCIRTRHGKSNNLKTKVMIIPDFLKPFWTKRVSMLRFIFYYYMNRYLSDVDWISPPWDFLIKQNGFKITSYSAFLINMLPWINRWYKKNWFELSI